MTNKVVENHYWNTRNPDGMNTYQNVGLARLGNRFESVAHKVGIEHSL